ncbi:hypothetical protein H0Z09_17295 [Pseudomonas sp. SWRI18]|uniref:hypothetical protein n=1 Tax=Pseudomonas sp. SWRI18 TaxID=2753888 RepID=UPI0016478BF4|nr:hypothetical protein [Pseudomonas sp. SWRI18]MBC3302888.1 hypothetical protein [Pseudomonas sp. SWRI18]
MNSLEPVNGKARIDYTQDTLFGPMAKHVECQVAVQRQTDGMVLKVFQPLPDDLHAAHTVVVALDGRRTSGVVKNSQRLSDDSLRLELEIQ